MKNYTWLEIFTMIIISFTIILLGIISFPFYLLGKIVDIIWPTSDYEREIWYDHS